MRNTRFLFLLLGTFILLAVSVAISSAAEEEEPPPGGDWMIFGDKEFTDNTGYVEGSVMITNNAQLIIENSVLTINQSLIIESYGTLIVTNSTVKFACTLTYDNRIDVMEWATVTIRDGDSDRTTTDDASTFMSSTGINYDWIVMQNATFTVRNSFIQNCGRYSPGPINDDGLVINADNTIIEGTNITDGYYGIIADNLEGMTVENVTIKDCQIGIFLMGTRDCKVITSKFLDNVDYGMQIRGFHGNLKVQSNEISGNGQANLHMMFSSGFSNELTDCTIGPGGQTGIYLEDIEDWDIWDVRVTQCQLGMDVDGGDMVLSMMSISDCAAGVNVQGDGSLKLFDLQLANTTITVGSEPAVNVTAATRMTWTNVVGTLSCVLDSNIDAILTLESCNLSFAKRGNTVTGLRAYRRGTVYAYHSTFDSPTSGEWIAHMGDGSRIEFKWLTFLDLGTESYGPRERGLFIAGSGTIEETTIADSLVGLVIGKANVNFVNITIRDCGTGIITDGDLGRGGAEIQGLFMERCNVTILAQNDGVIAVIDGKLHLGSEDGFNMSEGTVTLRDSWVSDPATGKLTATLKDLSTLNLVNTVSSQDFAIGPNHNSVNVFWYLNLTLKYLSNGAPVSEGKVTIKEKSGVIVHTGLEAGIDGKLERVELREKTITPDITITTPHTITISKGGLSDSFTLMMDTSKDHTFLMDNYPPVLVILHPENGALINMTTVTFTGEAWDAVITETEGLASMNYRVDGGDWMPIELPAVKAWSFDADLEDGFHVVDIEVYDKIGNHNSSTVSVEVDTGPPSLVVLAPEEGLVTNQTDLLVIGKAEPGVDVRVNGIQVDVAGDGSFNETINLEEGVNQVIVTATDAIGNTATEIRNVTLDTTPPEVVLDDPGPYITKEPTYTISGSKEVNATIYVNGYLHEYFDSDRFTTTVDLDEGLNPVLIFSVDQAGNNWSKTIIIERDSTPPSLSVARLPGHTNKATITVQGSTDDPDAIITVNGEEVTLSGLTFAHSLTLAEGENTITVEAEDPLGNAAEPDVQVVNVDTILPDLEVYTPKYVKTIDDEQDLSGRTEPGLPVVVFVSYGAYSKTYNLVADDEGAFEVTVALPQVGNHSVTVTAIDLAGNKATEELYFERLRPDVEPPPEPEGPSWFEDNWAVVILLAAVIGAGAVLLFTHASVKQRKEAMRTRAQARREAQEEWEDGSPDEVDDDEEEAEEDWEEAEEDPEEGEDRS